MARWTPELKVFADSYIADPWHDRVRAALSAWPALSIPEARKRANTALNRTDVRAYCQGVLGEVLEVCEVTPEKTYGAIAKIAYGNPQDYIREDGLPIPIQDLPAHVAAAIAEIEYTELGGIRRTKIKSFNRLEALKLLLQAQGLLQDRPARTGAEDITKTLQEIADKLPV